MKRDTKEEEKIGNMKKSSINIKTIMPNTSKSPSGNIESSRKEEKQQHRVHLLSVKPSDPSCSL